MTKAILVRWVWYLWRSTTREGADLIRSAFMTRKGRNGSKDFTSYKFGFKLGPVVCLNAGEVPLGLLASCLRLSLGF